MVALMGDPDARIAPMAADEVYERAWSRAPDYDPAKDPDRKPRAAFDPRVYSSEELELIEAALRLLMEPRTMAAPPSRSSHAHRGSRRFIGSVLHRATDASASPADLPAW